MQLQITTVSKDINYCRQRECSGMGFLFWPISEYLHWRLIDRGRLSTKAQRLIIYLQESRILFLDSNQQNSSSGWNKPASHWGGLVVSPGPPSVERASGSTQHWSSCPSHDWLQAEQRPLGHWSRSLQPKGHQDKHHQVQQANLGARGQGSHRQGTDVGQRTSKLSVSLIII